MQSPRKVSVVILNWNGKHYLKKFLPSVLQSTYSNLDLIVGDNASTDGSLEFLAQNFPSVKIIRNKENLGFAGGYNKILSQVESEYFLLLNSDVEVTPGWIEPLIDLIESDPLIAAVQPKLKDWNNKEYFEYAGAAGGFIDQFGYPFCRGRIFDSIEQDLGQYDVASEVFWASGAALLIKRAYWEEISGFDADFFAHMEEIDLCWRLKNIGYKIMYCPESTVYHVGGGTLDAENPYKTFLNFRNNLVMLLKNLPNDKVFFTLFARFWLDFITLLKFVAEGKFKHASAINKAHIQFFRQLSKNRQKRKNQVHTIVEKGFFNGSIVWQYFVNKRKYFSGLNLSDENR